MRKLIIIFLILNVFYIFSQEITIEKECFYRSISDDTEIGTKIGLLHDNGSFISFFSTGWDIARLSKFTKDFELVWTKKYGYYDDLSPQPNKTCKTLDMRLITEPSDNCYFITGFYNEPQKNIRNAYFTLGSNYCTGFQLDTSLSNSSEYFSSNMFFNKSEIYGDSFFYTSNICNNDTNQLCIYKKFNANYGEKKVVDTFIGFSSKDFLFNTSGKIVLFSLHEKNKETFILTYIFNEFIDSVSKLDFTLSGIPDGKILSEWKVIKKSDDIFYLIALINKTSSSISKNIYIAEINIANNTLIPHIIDLPAKISIQDAVFDKNNNLLLAGNANFYDSVDLQCMISVIDTNYTLQYTKIWKYGVLSTIISIAINGDNLLISGSIIDTVDIYSPYFFARIRYDESTSSATDLTEEKSCMISMTQVSGSLQIRTRDNLGFEGTISISDLLGNEIKRMPFSGCCTDVDISNYSSGIYIAAVYNDKARYFYKFIKE